MEFGLSGAFADTLEGVSTQFSGVWLISLGSNSGTPFYLNPQARVNTILTHSCDCARHAGFGCRETTAQRDAAACTRNGAESARTDPQHLSPIAKILAPAERFYGLGGGVERGLGVA
jgi:hypothetical protein